MQIDKGIPIPPATTNKNAYPFKDMDIGDSFFAPVTTARMNNAAQYYSRSGRRFTIRKTTENGVDGARVWRIA